MLPLSMGTQHRQASPHTLSACEETILTSKFEAAVTADQVDETSGGAWSLVRPGSTDGQGYAFLSAFRDAPT